jgi:hypothetical protein
LRLTQVVCLRDVGVDQIRDELGFADKIINELLLVGIVLANDFDGHAFNKSTRAKLLGFIHNSHSAFVNLADDLISKLVLDRE